MSTTPQALPAILAPGDPGYDEARVAWNLAADLRPAGVTTARSAEEVAAVIAHAGERGLRVAPLGTGHRAAALPDVGDAILLWTAIEPKVVVDADARTVRVGAGAIWADVVAALAPHGLAALSGSAADVGVVGYVLGGGMSWLARRHGLAAHSVRAFEAVLPDGRIVTANAEEEPELFWALRGGGGSFAVVTAVELEALELDEVYAGVTLWDGEHAEEILRRWHAWTRTAPETVTTSGRLLRLPPLPEIPEPLRDRPLVAIDGAALGGEAEALELLGPLRAVGEPILDTWGAMPPARLVEIHMDPPAPVPAIGDHTLLGELDDAAIAAFVEITGPDSGSPLLMAELRQLGGALARPGPGCGRVDGAFALFGVGAPMDPAMAPAIAAHLDRLLAAMAPWATGRAFLNFSERGGDAEALHDEETYARLCRVRAATDPGAVLVASHRVGAAA